MKNQELTPPATENQADNLITGIPDHLRYTDRAENVWWNQNNPQEEQAPWQEEPVADENQDWGYTRKAREHFGDTYGGRPLITRDGPVDGGVYYGTYGGEAIVVDSKKYPEQYDRVFDEVAMRASDESGNIQRGLVLNAAFDVVSEKMQYSKDGVDQLLGSFGDFKDGDKLDLGAFIEEGIGVCRHQALVVAVMLEKMKEQGHIRGDISVDRSQRWSPNGEREGHAWVRYTSHSGEVMILDVAQDYIGLIQDSEGDKQGWDYLRPEEQTARIAQEVGGIVVGNQNKMTQDDTERLLTGQLDEIKAQFSEEDQRGLWLYASGIMNKKEAQMNDDGESSTYYGQQAGQALNKLSPAAKNAARKYLRLMEKLHRARTAEE
jgi:hypothetical protein